MTAVARFEKHFTPEPNTGRMHQISRDDWAMAELERRRAEDARFAEPPFPNTPEWHAFCRMKRDRARRRKARGYSRATANALVERAAAMEVLP